MLTDLDEKMAEILISVLEDRWGKKLIKKQLCRLLGFPMGLYRELMTNPLAKKGIDVYRRTLPVVDRIHCVPAYTQARGAHNGYHIRNPYFMSVDFWNKESKKDIHHQRAERWDREFVATGMTKRQLALIAIHYMVIEEHDFIKEWEDTARQYLELGL